MNHSLSPALSILDTTKNPSPATLPSLGRRDLFRLAGVVGTVAVGVGSLSSCAAAPVVVIADSWLAQLAASTLAGIIAAETTEAFDGAWASWQAGRQAAYKAQSLDGFGFVSDETYGDEGLPNLYFVAAKGKEFDHATDRLVVCIAGGKQTVVFESWAWKALYLFVSELTSDRSDEDRERYKALCRVSLMPTAKLSTESSTSSGRSDLLGYSTKNGQVEMNRRTDGEGHVIVQVTASGIPDAYGKPTVKDITVST